MPKSAKVGLEGLAPPPPPAITNTSTVAASAPDKPKAERITISNPINSFFILHPFLLRRYCQKFSFRFSLTHSIRAYYLEICSLPPIFAYFGPPSSVLRRYPHKAARSALRSSAPRGRLWVTPTSSRMVRYASSFYRKNQIHSDGGKITQSVCR